MTTYTKREAQENTAAPLAVLVFTGVLLEGVYLALWVFGYPISQAPDWSVAFLTQHHEIWESFRPFLEAAQFRLPVEMGIQRR